LARASRPLSPSNPAIHRGEPNTPWSSAGKIGSMLAAIGREFGGVDLDITRDKTAADPAIFE
jgi:hypothetical protein